MRAEHFQKAFCYAVAACLVFYESSIVYLHLVYRHPHIRHDVAPSCRRFHTRVVEFLYLDVGASPALRARLFCESRINENVHRTRSTAATKQNVFYECSFIWIVSILPPARVCVNPALVFYNIWALTWNRNNNESTNGHDKIYSFIFTFIIIILAWNSNDEISIKLWNIYIFFLYAEALLLKNIPLVF